LQFGVGVLRMGRGLEGREEAHSQGPVML
jgi:hypothetical protein